MSEVGRIEARSFDLRNAHGVAIGDTVTQYNTFAGNRTVPFPHQVGVIPLLADGFVYRDYLPFALPSAENRPVAGWILSGLGGVGKTQVAASYSHRVWGERGVDLLIWVNAASRANIINTYAAAARDVTGIDDVSADDAAARLLNWFSTAGGDGSWSSTTCRVRGIWLDYGRSRLRSVSYW